MAPVAPRCFCGRHHERPYSDEPVAPRAWRLWETREYKLVRDPYDRDSLMLAMTRACNTAADILAGIDGWRRQLGDSRETRMDRTDREA